jgi:phosphorylcholine metabolism protein LicD
MKYDWNISEEDKKRILNLHESATKRLYLTEDEESVFDINIFPPSKEEIQYGQSATTGMRNKNVSFTNFPNLPRKVRKAFEEISIDYQNKKNSSDRNYGIVGRYLMKHKDVFQF